MNIYRARTYLEAGGTLEEAEETAGDWGFEPAFVAAVRTLRGILTRDLVRVEALEEDLRSVGIDPIPRETVRRPRWRPLTAKRCIYEELRPLPGGGFLSFYVSPDQVANWERYLSGCDEGSSDDDGSKFRPPSFYLPPDQAARVNLYRARECLNGGGTFEEAARQEGCWGFEPKFVSSVEALTASRQGKSSDASKSADRPQEVEPTPDRCPDVSAGKPEQMGMMHQELLTLGYLKRKLEGISAFLLLTAVGTITADLRTGLAVGLLGWAIVAIIMRLLYMRHVKLFAAAVEKQAHELGFNGDLFMAADGTHRWWLAVDDPHLSAK
ncbi:MAG: hypothetical protein ACRD2B_12535 [Terriglobia bacterium]